MKSINGFHPLDLFQRLEAVDTLQMKSYNG